MIPVVCTHTIPTEPLRAWLADHGLDIRDVREATISIGYPGRHGHPAWLDASWWKRNAHGERYWDGLGQEAASGSSSIPLRSWPPLTPAITGLEST